MRSLNSICRARDEARYISRSWSNQSAPDVAGYVHFDEPVKSPDDMIATWVKGEDGLLHKTMITRAQFDADFQAMLAKNREEALKP
jgi:hypothetical protein